MLASIMSVPETSIYKNYCFVLGHNNVWFARQFTDIDPITIPSAEKFMSYKNLRPGILGSYMRHTVAALFSS